MLAGYRPEFDRAEENLRHMLGWGFTTIFSMAHAQTDFASFLRLRRAAATPGARLPNFFGVGGAITVTGGHASQPEFGGSLLADTPEDARRVVREMKAVGVDAIKFVYDDMAAPGVAPLPMMSPAVMQAIIDESHAQGLKVYVHARQLPRAKEVLRAGADGLVHAVITGPVDDEFVSLMEERNGAYVTTHAVYHALIDPAGWARRLEALDERNVIPAAVYRQLKESAPPGAEARLAPVVRTLRTNLRVCMTPAS